MQPRSDVTAGTCAEDQHAEDWSREAQRRTIGRRSVSRARSSSDATGTDGQVTLILRLEPDLALGEV